MYSKKLSVAALTFTSILLSFALPAQVNAQMQSTSSCLRATDDHRLLVADSNPNTCQTRSTQVTPSVYPLRLSDEHGFELFNNSYRDILFLHLVPLNSPDEEMVFGGTRKLAPGRAWSVDLSHGCTYSLLVEYEDGIQDFYEAVNTCDYRGIQLR